MAVNNDNDDDASVSLLWSIAAINVSLFAPVRPTRDAIRMTIQLPYPSVMVNVCTGVVSTNHEQPITRKKTEWHAALNGVFKNLPDLRSS